MSPVENFPKSSYDMAYSGKFGIADPLMSDIAKGATVAVATSLLAGQRLPSIFELGVGAGALTIYWYTVHQYI